MVSGTDSTSPVRARLTEEDVGADEDDDARESLRHACCRKHHLAFKFLNNNIPLRLRKPPPSLRREGGFSDSGREHETHFVDITCDSVFPKKGLSGGSEYSGEGGAN